MGSGFASQSERTHTHDALSFARCASGPKGGGMSTSHDECAAYGLEPWALPAGEDAAAVVADVGVDVGQAHVHDHCRIAGIRGGDDLDQGFDRVLERVWLVEVVVAAIPAGGLAGSLGSSAGPWEREPKKMSGVMG